MLKHHVLYTAKVDAALIYISSGGVFLSKNEVYLNHRGCFFSVEKG